MKLKGSETQITWATSILTDINTVIDHFSVDADKIVITHDSAKAMFSAIVSN